MAASPHDQERRNDQADKDNLERVPIDSGYLRREDVYGP